MKTYLLLTSICLMLAFSSVFGQQSDPDNIIQLQNRADSLTQRNRQEVMRELRLDRRLPRGPLATEEIKRIKIALMPSAEDFEKNKSFLLQPKTGLFRLKSDFGCKQKYVVRVDGDCQNSLPIGEFYSFRTKDYSLSNFFDLTLKDGKLTSGSFLEQGILVSLGDISLENVSFDSAGMKFLVDFKPETKNSEVKRQFREISSGINSNGFHYGKSFNAAVNMTYACRIIAYRVENRLTYPSRKIDGRFSMLPMDKRIDLTVAFRVTRKDNDGSLIILWKELNRQKAPKIVFQKGENLTDISQ
jgi:hypothetical protein